MQADRNKEVVDGLRGDMEALEAELREAQEQIKACKADAADWCERAMVAADQLVQGQGRAALPARPPQLEEATERRPASRAREKVVEVLGWAAFGISF